MKKIDLESIQKQANYKILSIASHRDVLILISENSQPERTMDWIDTLSLYEVKRLVAVQDWKGGISLFWQRMPNSFVEVNDIHIPDGDVWTVMSNIEI